MNRAALEHVIQGQAERNVMKATQSHYLSKLRVMTGLLNEAEPAIRNEALEIVDGDVRKHTGDAKHIYVLKLPMSADTAKLLFAYISINRHLAKSSRRKKKRSSFEINQENACTTSAPSTGDSIMNERDLNPGQNVVTVSAQTYQNYKSALRWWHEYDSPNMSKVGHVWPVEVDRAICAAIATYKRDIGLKKRNGIMKVRDGKLPYNLYGYKTICAHFMSKIPTARSQSWHEGLFASLFTKLSVNTIGRSDNIDDILTCNMDWINDALTIVFGTTKVDQTGTKTTDMKRLYANPFMPEVCVILDLAVYVWCKHCTSTEDAEYVFDGADQEKRYYNLLVQAVEKDIDSSLDLGCAREDIGTHSNRKFAESTSVSRIDGPSRTQVCLRAGQGVGRTQDCYMFSEDDGDALVGRTVAQLKLNADEFDVLPPHWCNAAVIQLNEYGWGNILPSYNYYCEGFQRIIRMLFASLVYHHHEGNIKRLYHPRHPIHCQPIFTDPTLLNSLKDKVLLCHQYCTDTGMSAEGVPGIILISREIRNFKAEVDKDKSSVLQRLGVVEETLSQKLRELPAEIVNEILKRVRVEGAVEIRKEDILEMISAALSNDNGPIKTLTESIQQMSQQQNKMIERLESGNAYQGSSLSAPSRDAFMRLRSDFAKEKFEFPSYNVWTMWGLWWFGNSRDEIGPLRYARPLQHCVGKSSSTNCSRTSKVMRTLVRLAMEKGIIRGDGEITMQNSSSVFDATYPILLDLIYDRKPARPNDLNINTLANRLGKLNRW